MFSKNYQCLDSNLGPLKATALPTLPQPLSPKVCLIFLQIKAEISCKKEGLVAGDALG